MRIPPITPGSHPELAQLEQRIRAKRGRISPLYQVLLNSPPIAQGWEQMLSAIRLHCDLAPDLRELAILRVAVLNRATYEFEAHVPHALAAGLSPAVIDGLRQESTPDRTAMTPAQELVLRLTDAMTRDIVVGDALYAEVRRQFSERQQVDLIATVAAYNMVSRFLVALEIGHQPT